MNDLTLILYFGKEQIPFIDPIIEEMRLVNAITYWKVRFPKEDLTKIEYTLTFETISAAYAFGHKQGMMALTLFNQ